MILTMITFTMITFTFTIFTLGRIRVILFFLNICYLANKAFAFIDTLQQALA